MSRRVSVLLASICLLAVWIGTPVLSVVHVVLVEHQYCAEHQRLEEVSAGHASSVAKAVDGEASKVAPGQPENSDPEHTGCAFGENFTLEDDCILPSDPLVTVFCATEAPPAIRFQDAVPSFPLLRFAPKSSPPQIA